MARIKFKYIESFYNMEWEELISAFHLKDRMSSFEIAEKIRQDTGIEYTYRQVQKWLKKFGILRSHGEALKNRVLTGRMDYSKRKTDYQGVFIDYDSRDRARGYLWANGLSGMLKNKGDTTRLAHALGLTVGDVSDWKLLRHRVSVDYQEKICAYFGLDKTRIFSETKAFNYPKKSGKGVNQRKRFIQKGYRYAKGLKDVLYLRGISMTDLAEKLNKPLESISKWLSRGGLISPVDQERIKNILGMPCEEVFSKRR
jgi:hypothetical protein